MYNPPFTPTKEQADIIERSKFDGSFAVQAFAGSGKTTTAEQIARATPQKKWVYIAFNKRAIEDSRDRMPPNVVLKTAHSCAFGPVGSKYKDNLVTDYKLKQSLMGIIRKRYFDKTGSEKGMAAFSHIVIDAIRNFCSSADQQVEWFHFDSDKELDIDLVIATARECWDAMVDSLGGVGMTHDGYLKIWQIRGGRIPSKYIMFDEAQDASPPMLDVVLRTDADKIFIGDPWQSIYGWRGAIDTFDAIGHLQKFPLTQSWRFGQDLADIGNSILSRMGETNRLIGMGETTVYRDERLQDVDMVISRTTGGLVAEAAQIAQSGKRIHIVGGTSQILDWLQETYQMRRVGKSHHRDFQEFDSYADLLEVAETSTGRPYRPYVRMVESYRSSLPDIIQDIRCAHVESPTDADTVLTTGHRGKGAEAGSVRVANDVGGFVTLERNGIEMKEEDNFDIQTMKPTDLVKVDKAEANLLYVILTRAKRQLDMSSVHYLDTNLEMIDIARQIGAQMEIITPESNTKRALRQLQERGMLSAPTTPIKI